jgi:tRNA nucleotidyltransferase (CCA-adding enzyme)
MNIVISHEGTDFDALASMFAVSKLYPGTRIIIGGSVNRNVRRFLTLYGTFFNYSIEKELDWKSVKKIWIVDASSPSRSGKAEELIQAGRVAFAIYDHHPETPDGLKGEQVVVQPTGACTTILVELIKEQTLPLNSLEATLLILGIYEDTGSLTFPTTTARDLQAAAFLVEHGAKLSAIPDYVNMQLTNEQRDVLKLMVNSLTVVEVNGIQVHFTSVQVKDYVDGVSFLVHKLMDLEEINVLFSLFDMENKVYVIARSRLEEIDVSIITTGLNGGGHKSAASASIKGSSLEEVRKKIINMMKRSFSFTRAVDIMSTPVKTVHRESSINDAYLTLIRSGFSGLPVVDDEGMLVGIIARRDMEKAIHHGLQNAPIKSFMSPQIIGVSPRDSIYTIRNLMVENDIGRVPVIKAGKPIGIITRSDLLRVFHQKENIVVNELTRLNVSESVFAHFIAADLELINLISGFARRVGVRTYLVGGVVRDIILGVPNHDLDLVVEGDAIEFSQNLNRLLNGKVVAYPPFGTSVVFMKDKKRIDFASARKEFYRFPGAAPDVEYSDLKKDLFRRDFTLNAMAISIYPDNWGELYDFFGGYRDLRSKILRILHPLSFVDDPARSIRAVRFEKKYGFHIEPFTMSLLKQTIRKNLLDSIKPDRLKEEIQLILELPNYYRYLERLYQLDMIPSILPGCIWKREYSDRFIDVEKRLPEVKTILGIDRFLYQLTPLFDDFDIRQISLLQKRLALSRHFTHKVVSYHSKKSEFRWAIEEKDIRPSEVYLRCRSIPLEFLYYLLSFYPENSLASQRLNRYLKEWITIKTILKGSDLQEMGIKAGPHYATMLDELKLAKIDGHAMNRLEEEQLIRQYWERVKKRGEQR